MPVNSEEAGQWLTQLFDDLAHDPRYKHGEDMLERMAWEIRRYDPEHRQAIMNAAAQWLKGSDPQKILTSLALIRDLQDIDHLTAVEQLRDEVIAGSSALPQMWLSTVDNTIQRLQQHQ